MTAAHVACGEDTFDAGGILAVCGLGIGALILLHAQLIQQLVLRPGEAQRQKHQLCRIYLLAAGNLGGDKAAVAVFFPLDENGVDFLHVAVLVAHKTLGGHQVVTGIAAMLGGGFLLAVVHLEGFGPFRPRVIVGPVLGSLGHNFELVNTVGAMTDRGSDTVGTGVAAADDDNVLACCGDISAVGMVGIQQALGVLVQELHRQVDALQLAAFSGKVAAFGGAAAKHNSVKLSLQLFRRIILANFCVGDEGDAFLLQQLHTAFHNGFLQLHVGDAVHQKPAGTVGAFEYGNGVPCFIQLGGSSQTGRTGADNGYLLAGALNRRLGFDPALFEALIHDRPLDILDGDRAAA
ncbi:hypothetical protein D3C75_692980 [compost metagenome]